MGSKSTDAYQSRKAWEKHWGRKVPHGYIVHHNDGNPTNRSIDNLSIMTLSAHNKKEKKGKTWAEFGKGHKNKPNKGSSDGVQRRFRK